MAEVIVEPFEKKAVFPSVGTKRLLDVKLSSIGVAALFLFMLFENPLEGLIPALGYSDELLFAATALLAAARLAKGHSESGRGALAVMILLLAVLVVGFTGLFFSGYQQSVEAVLKDVLAFVKFPVTLISALCLTANWDSREALGMCATLSKVFIIVCFVFCIVNVVTPMEAMSHDVRLGIASFKFVFSHPTFLVLSLVLAFAMVAQEDDRLDPYKVMCLVALALTMRDKAFGFIGLVIALCVFRIQKKNRLIPYLMLSALVVLVVAWPKIQLYLSWSSSPREAMYIGAFQFAFRFFPFGSGFGTFASSLSGEYYSDAYYALGISGMEGLRPASFEAAGDNGIAYYIGQFGVLGFILCVAIGWLLCRNMLQRVNQNPAARFSLIALLGYLAIALTVESTLVNASGVFSAIVLALISSCSSDFSRKQSSHEYSANYIHF